MRSSVFVSGCLMAAVEAANFADSYGRTAFQAKAIPEVLAGLVYGITHHDDLEEIQACMGDSSAIYKDIEQELLLLHGGFAEIIKAVHLGISIIKSDIPEVLHDCENMGDDLAAIGVWASEFKQPVALAKHVFRQVLGHWGEIQTDIGELKSDWEFANYFMFGNDLAEFLDLMIGP
eukprot:CAMPEP_0176376836 /NCGR_PEP_ID=MMETSP0126-20121128/28465_1 /TAXON_ID=141414 ORGANISM="Strombidinopsis acuminatum, Strain SPMC142" /NCGR_SAMPLE_ID=MMETSP0126 /ASSEMBLY_ACC=CAM_ASM_000229 /LENGTH=175 /DNA_ID=CAMNT_0017738429 /DNA_START=13 /DNA_END=540 /DNA_ORIENTATION=+